MENKRQTEYPQALYAVAHTDIGRMPFNNAGRTLRLVLPCNVQGHALQVRFSNRCGTQPLPVGAVSLALCNQHGVLLPNTLVPLTVGGTLAFELPAGEDVDSDRVAFELQPGNWLALNLYYPTATRVQSGNWVGQKAQRSRPGNFSADLELPGPGLLSRFARTVITTDFTVNTSTVAHITAFCPQPGVVIGCFGDSITQQSNWTVPLEKRLHRLFPGQVSLCNLGISGNRLLRGSPAALGGLNGVAGMERFDHDLLALPGLTHGIVALGSNDIGLPGSHNLPVGEVPSLQDYAVAMEALAARLHKQGVKAYVGTLAPRALNAPYDEARELLRMQMNDWIRTAGCFDAVLDFDAALRREDGMPGMKAHCGLPDGLHPSPYGGMQMARAIDVGLFVPRQGGGAVG